MKPERAIRHEFVEFIPETLDEGVIYISIPYATASHNCFCGCGMKVVTPFSPTDWKLIFDGKTVTLDPSIGSWSLPCRSHYWIVRNKVRWAGQWTDKQIQAGRAYDSLAKQSYYREAATPPKVSKSEVASDAVQERDNNKSSVFARLRKWWRS